MLLRQCVNTGFSIKIGNPNVKKNAELQQIKKIFELSLLAYNGTKITKII